MLRQGAARGGRCLSTWICNPPHPAPRPFSSLLRPQQWSFFSTSTRSSRFPAARPPSAAFPHVRRFYHTTPPALDEGYVDGPTAEGANEQGPTYVVPESFAIVYVSGRQYKVSKGTPPPYFTVHSFIHSFIFYFFFRFFANFLFCSFFPFPFLTIYIIKSQINLVSEIEKRNEEIRKRDWER